MNRSTKCPAINYVAKHVVIRAILARGISRSIARHKSTWLKLKNWSLTLIVASR